MTLFSQKLFRAAFKKLGLFMSQMGLAPFRSMQLMSTLRVERNLKNGVPVSVVTSGLFDAVGYGYLRRVLWS